MMTPPSVFAVGRAATGRFIVGRIAAEKAA
jgi:hypothetical protein